MKLKGLPEREPGESPATERQIRYLLDLVPWLQEADLRKLGIKQASYLIDEAIDSRDSEEDEEEIEEENNVPPKKSSKNQKKNGCSPVTIIFLILAAWFVVKMFEKSSGSSSEKPQVRKIDSQITAIPNPVEPSIETRSQKLMTLDNVIFPCEVAAAEKVKLLNTHAEEVTIKSGSLFVIESRNQVGHVTARLNGVLLFGNEDNLIGKVNIINEKK